MLKNGDLYDTTLIRHATASPSPTSVRIFRRATRQAYATNADPALIAPLLMKSAVAGNRDAIYALATWKLFGEAGIFRRDPAEGARLLKLAADAGSSSAAYDLAVSYETGVGVRTSLARACQLYVRAALLGDPQAHEEVGRCYYWGIGVRRDRKMAAVWYERAEALLGRGMDRE